MKSLGLIGAMGLYLLIAFVPIVAVILAGIGFLVVLYTTVRTSARAEAIAEQALGAPEGSGA